MKDYADYLRHQSAENWLLLYFSNWEPSPESIPAVEALALRAQGRLLRLDFYDLASWLERCALACQSAIVRTVIHDLSNYVRTSVNYENMTSPAQREIAALLADPASFEAARGISQALVSVQGERLRRLNRDVAHASVQRGWNFTGGMNLHNAKTGFTFWKHERPDEKISFEWYEHMLSDFALGLIGSTATAADTEQQNQAVGVGESEPG